MTWLYHFCVCVCAWSSEFINENIHSNKNKRCIEQAENMKWKRNERRTQIIVQGHTYICICACLCARLTTGLQWFGAKGQYTLFYNNNKNTTDPSLLLCSHLVHFIGIDTFVIELIDIYIFIVCFLTSLNPLQWLFFILTKIIWIFCVDVLYELCMHLYVTVLCVDI